VRVSPIVRGKPGRTRRALGLACVVPPKTAGALMAASPVDEDLVENPAGGEMLLHHLLPAAEDVLDLEELHLRKLRLVFFDNSRRMHAIEELGENVLALVAVEELEIGGRHLARAAPVNDLVD